MTAPLKPLSVLVIGRSDSPHHRALARLPSEVQITVGTDDALIRQVASMAEVVCWDMGHDLQITALWDQMPALRWIHSIAAGVDNLLFSKLVESDVILTNARGVFKRSLAEFVMAGALHFAKDLPRLERQRRARIWQAYDMQELHGRTMGIVGYGEIGRAVASQAKAFDMRVLALRRRSEKSADDPLVDEMIGRERLAELLSRSDYVVLAAALTPETRGMVGEREIAAMKLSGVLINIGRGPLVVEAALIDALRRRRIRGAVLDVFEVEPLPPDHALFALDNVLLSPHTADHVPGWLDESVALFVRNVERYCRNQPLLNIVDKRAGY